ncbi:hypothetical protein EC2848050_3001 [Escherichia coli 2848050]|nr:hypothetical protein EC2848050_3001 [Escherichia coli 2848050]
MHRSKRALLQSPQVLNNHIYALIAKVSAILPAEISLPK